MFHQYYPTKERVALAEKNSIGKPNTNSEALVKYPREETKVNWRTTMQVLTATHPRNMFAMPIMNFSPRIAHLDQTLKRAW